MSEPISFQLSYGDCDTVGIAYFAVYYPWMERAYSTWLHARGIDSGGLVEQLGVLSVGVHSECTYLQMVKVFDVLTITMVLQRMGTTSWTVGFDFRRDGEVVTHGTMTFVCRSPEGGKADPPPQLLSVLGSLPAAAA